MPLTMLSYGRSEFLANSRLDVGLDLTILRSIEGNCVLIGACIPTLYPLIKKIFGARVLGGSTPKNSNQNGSGPNKNYAIITIGSSPQRKRYARGAVFELSQLDTIDEDNKHQVAIEVRSLNNQTVGLRDEDSMRQWVFQKQRTTQTLYPPGSAL